MSDTNIFRKSISNLFPGKTYYFQFRWKYVDGSYGEWSVTKTATAPGTLKVEAPTLATGLTAATASFGITIDWDGTYSSSTFLGFKAINIYATTSNLGSSTTTSLTNNLVGSMTVDQVKNRITIGSTLLKNILSLTSTSVYTTPIFFYYITINEENQVYKSSGVATYTRINSSGISPTQANFVDLANGVISIENLIAGNGQFTEYLRAGIRNNNGSGARVEISGSSANITSTSGGTILPGFTIYDSAGGEALRAPLSGGLTITGNITGSVITGSSFSLPAFGAGGEFLIANNILLNSPSLLWGTAATPSLAIYQAGGGTANHIQANGLNGDGILYISASNTANAASIELQGPNTKVIYTANNCSTNNGLKNIKGTSTAGTPTGGTDGEIVLVYTP